MQKLKRPVSIILSILMVVSMFVAVPVTASAATYVAKIGSTGYETLEDAFAHAVDGDTITVLADCSGNGIKAPQGKFNTTGLTVDFNNHTYTMDGAMVGSTGTETQAFQLLKDNKITFKNGTIYSGKAKMLVQNYSNLTLEGMTLTLNNPNYAYAYTLSNNNGNVVIEDTTINANPAGGFAFDVCRFNSYPSVHVTVKGDSVINGNVEVSASGNTAKDGFSLNLEGGEMYGTVVVDASAQTAMDATPEIATLTTDPDFKFYVAQIGDNKYETLEAAFAAAVDGNTITVLADSAGNGIKAPQGKFATGLTVDFGGHKYTVDANTVGSTGTETQAFQLLKGNTITFKNGTIYSEVAKMLVQNYSNLTLDNLTLTLNNPTYSSAYTLSNNNGNVVIDDTTINANPAGGFAFDVCRFNSYPSVHVTVTGDSVINGDVEISASKSDAKDGFSLTLESGELNGDIVLDQTAQNVIANNPDKVTITKDAAFEQAAPAGYKWDANGELVPVTYVAQIGDDKYETLEAAFAAAQDGNIITVLADCAGNGIKVPEGKFTTGLTVDFGGKTYTVNANTVGSTGTETQGFQLLKDNKITFKNGAITGSSVDTSTLLFLIQNYSDLTLDNMNLSLVGTYYDQYTLSNNNGNIVINGSTINAPDYSWLGYNDPAELGSYAFDVCRFSSYPSVNVTVTGGSTINGSVEVSATKSDAKDGFSLNLVSGTLNGKIVLDQTAKDAMAASDKVVIKKADTFTQEAPEGYKWNSEGVLVPCEYVAEVVSGNNVGKKYETVNDAVAAAGENGEVKLIADINGNVGIGGVNTPYNTTLDLNGHTITNTSGSGITLYSQFTAPATFTIKDTSANQTGRITINKKYPGDGCISDSSGRHVIIEGGTYESDDKALYISSDEGWTINGGTFNGKIHVISDVAITGGTFHGEVVQSSKPDYSTPYPWTEIPAEIAISGGTFNTPVPEAYCAEGYKPKDNGNGTYGVTKKYFAGRSITLNGNIELNFWVDNNVAKINTANSAKIVFTWDGGTSTAEVNLKGGSGEKYLIKDDYYLASVELVAAQMAHKVKGELIINGTKVDEANYSVQDYAEELYNDPSRYDNKKPNELRALAKAMLNYGAMAQTVFDSALKDHPAPANKTVGNNGYEGVTADQIGAAINGSASNLNNAAAAFDAEFYTSSLIYLSKNTLRLYFTPASKTVGALDGKGFSDSLSGYYYYVDHENIPAAELDDQQTFTVGDTTFTFSALDYAKAVVNSGMGDDQKNLAKALFLYNQAANAYFG